MFHLTSVMYHYVRNPEETKFKGIHAVKEKKFIQQVKFLASNYEMATLELILDFLSGKYIPKKDLCILTFDDGLKEHAVFVTDILETHKVQGLFFLPTASIQEHYVLPVHKNHFLLAYLPFKKYKSSFLKKLSELYPFEDTSVNSKEVAATYRWDIPEVAGFKYLLNYQLERPIRNQILQLVFEETFGEEADFAKSLYINWNEAKQMQKSGMLLGGHTHRHNVLSSLSETEQEFEIDTCMNLLRSQTHPQIHWPFSYPFGKENTFNSCTKSLLDKNKIALAFTSEVGITLLNTNPYHIKRIDPKDLQIYA